MKASNFQIALTVMFIFFIGIGMLMFAGVIKIGKDAPTEVTGSVTLWGTFDSLSMTKILGDLNRGSDLIIKYVEKSPERFEGDLIEALASGTGPDLFMLPQDSIWRYKNKIIPVPYASFSERDFKNSFVNEAELYLSPDGVLALPISVDPLVMYWNRDLLAANGLATPPRSWDDVMKDIPILTKKTDSGIISQSAIALGQFNNVDHAKDILSLLMLQAGNPITTRSGTLLVQTLRNSVVSGDTSILPAERALSFYSQFTDPTGPHYTWNRSLPRARDQFAGGNVAFYMGYASELFAIQKANPNLNFDVTTVPQFNVATPVTFGTMYGLAIAKGSANTTAAFTAASKLITLDAMKVFATTYSLPPVRRDLLSIKPENPYAVVFYNSALISRAWLDPRPAETSTIWQRMLEDVLSNTLSSSQSVNNAAAQLELLIRANL